MRRMAVGLLNIQLNQVTAKQTLQFPGLDAFTLAGSFVQSGVRAQTLALAA